jgi:hypothetical protein
MVLEHVAAILLFSGPLFYIGLWMLLDPADVVSIPELVLPALVSLVQRVGGPEPHKILQIEHADIRRLHRIVRLTVPLSSYSLSRFRTLVPSPIGCRSFRLSWLPSFHYHGTELGATRRDRAGCILFNGWVETHPLRRQQPFSFSIGTMLTAPKW